MAVWDRLGLEPLTSGLPNTWLCVQKVLVHGSMLSAEPCSLFGVGLVQLAMPMRCLQGPNPDETSR